MINCPKCQVPNQDNASVCAACGAALAGHQFAQALDAAQADAPPAAQPPAQPAQPAPLPAAAPPIGMHQDPLGALDPSMAQAEINQFMAEQKSKKRTKTFVYLALTLIAAGASGFLWFQSQRRQDKEQAVINFYSSFRKIDDETIANFWKCSVRAKIRDVRLASDAAEITTGLQKAFSNFPKSQPDRLRDKCIPMLVLADTELGKLKPPEGFTAPLADFQTILKEVKTTFTTYALKINQRKKQAIDEQEVRNAHADFHRVIGGSGGFVPTQDAPKAMAYYNIIKCVIPDLVDLARKLKKPPDSQPIVDLYHKCKDDPKFADKIRGECFAKRNEDLVRNKEFRIVAQKMSGDDRDLNAINYCFKKINHGFAFEELKAIAEVFGKYRNKGRGRILKAVEQVKEELAE